MNIRFRSKNFNFTEGAKESISKELEKVFGLFDNDTLFDIYILKRDKDYKCEIKCQKGKSFVRSEETGKSIEYSVENAVSTLKKRMRKIKDMKIAKRRNRIQNEDIEIDESAGSEDDYNIERRKSFLLEEIFEEDAILNLESVNHPFYVFRNIDLDGRVCVLYKREKGYGLIEIE